MIIKYIQLALVTLENRPIFQEIILTLLTVLTCETEVPVTVTYNNNYEPMANLTDLYELGHYEDSGWVINVDKVTEILIFWTFRPRSVQSQYSHAVLNTDQSNYAALDKTEQRTWHNVKSASQANNSFLLCETHPWSWRNASLSSCCVTHYIDLLTFSPFIIPKRLQNLTNLCRKKRLKKKESIWPH